MSGWWTMDMDTVDTDMVNNNIVDTNMVDTDKDTNTDFVWV